MMQIWRLLLIESLALVAALAQPAPISSIQIYAQPAGARFYVDGQLYYGPQTFLWPQGSKHIVQFPLEMINGASAGYQQSLDGNVRYGFGGWEDNRSLLQPATSPNQTVTADPAITFIRANVTVSHHVWLRFSSSPTGPPANCGAPGDAPADSTRAGIIVGGPGACYGSDAEWFQPAGAITLNAIPYPGWIFTGWYINGTLVSPYLATINIAGPTTIRPVFQLGRRVQFVTEPQGLQVVIDRTPTPTSSFNVVDSGIVQPGPNTLPCEPNLNLPPAAPVGMPMLCFGEFDFLPGSQHAVGAVTPQRDQSGKYWVFDSFSNGLGQNSVYTTPASIAGKDVITAKFVPGVQSAILTNPGGLKIQIDGRDNWQNYNFIWAAGSSHTITAPSSQVDSNGRRWTFQGWSNGGVATQNVVADISNPNFRLTATYAALGQVKIATNPPGIKIQVDGFECTAPCTVDRQSGTQIAIAAPASIPQSDTSRLDFLGWSDGGASSRTLTVGSGVNSIWANYGTSYRVSIGSDPENGADLRFDPPSPDLFYSGDSVVAVTAAARPGFKFRRWGGDLAGVFPIAQLVVSGPRTIAALLDRVPYITPAGIRNAAGLTPDGTVAPGSIIAITGESLAPRLATGPTNPLAQTIADTVVLVNDRILPLLFVSPAQINAQVLSDLPDGDYTLTVRTTGQAEVTGTFTISRNAPGLFTRSDDARPFGMIVHEDGTPVTPDSPARKGETVSVLGTGFGPYDQKVIDGFITPDPSNYVLLDPVEISAGDQSVTPTWTGAAPGLIGTVITKFKIDDSLPAASNVELAVTVNGKASNKVLLPIE
jgi:uncharacterized protein (TIGR03437 family)